ncbi:u3 small nucleolar RNA-associated protein 11 [Thelephora ganbajun]|uniref:U3 small nucleolar RNA-associated protein 11 n=1 Tax=Thelephora ganbajun TaxID=370292 RepID=A0ACB6Z1T0_THEGA|nr:u3 small nucleolar RNA-associated protein 11 [Thelephora ganbajun]
MSSLRNSLYRRNHKERSQLAHRAKFGILEKHKDYVLRARDYHSKQERIKTLQRKAANRNKDEFYFGMVNQRTNEGVHIQNRGTVAMPVDMVKILKTQDENYVRTMRGSNAKKIDRIKSQLSTMADLVHEGVGVDEGELLALEKSGVLASRKARGKAKAHSMSGPKHIVFMEEGEEDTSGGRSIPAAPETVLDDDESDIDLGWKSEGRQKRKKGKPKGQDGSDSQLIGEESKKHRRRLVQELSARVERDQQLRYAERELEMQRLLMGKGRTKKLKGVEVVKGRDDGDEDEDGGDHGDRPARTGEKIYKPRMYKWKAERKR